MRLHHKSQHARVDAQAHCAKEPNSVDATSTTRGQSKGYVVVAIFYLLGLCMGALDRGIVNPARTVIQNTLGVDDSLGVWILTIYTLAYAASIPTSLPSSRLARTWQLRYLARCNRREVRCRPGMAR